jgi:hypothetical protein
VRKLFFSFGQVLIIVALSGCGIMPGSSTHKASDPAKTVPAEQAAITKPTLTPTPTLTGGAPAPTVRTQVPWADYDSGLQAEIDNLTTSKDCLGIQSYFGMATATEESIKAKTGHGNEALTSYLNEALILAQCG